jgi:hypothetical protein
MTIICKWRLEWISSHQCTSCGWARWGRFPDERKSHPPCPDFYFFSTSSLPQNFPPSYLPPPTCHLPPPSYLPPTNPSPLTPSPELQRRWAGASLELGAGLERERSWSLELGAGLEREQAWSLELGAGLERERAWSLERLEPDPRRT